jgi:predicted DNA-binding protein (MmcQ/YjbR family)
MDREAVNTHCAGLPGAEVSDPWGGGHEAWKVGGKMFACIGAITPGVSLKTPSVEAAQLLIEQGVAAKAPYFHGSWVLIGWHRMPDEEMRGRLDEAYRIIRTGLPKKVQAALPPL